MSGRAVLIMNHRACMHADEQMNKKTHVKGSALLALSLFRKPLLAFGLRHGGPSRINRN